MNLERIRKRLRAAAIRGGRLQPLIIKRWAKGAPDPLPASDGTTLIALPGESVDDTCRRHGVDSDHGRPMISLTLNLSSCAEFS